MADRPDDRWDAAVSYFVVTARLRADSVSTGPGWIAVQDREHPNSHNGNRLIVHGATQHPLAELVARNAVGLSPGHVAVTTYHQPAASEVLELQQQGFGREDLLVMGTRPDVAAKPGGGESYSGAVAVEVVSEDDSFAGASRLEATQSDSGAVTVEVVSEDEAAVFAAELWHAESPQMPDEVVIELVHRRQRLDRAAVVKRLAIRDGSRIVAAADVATRGKITELDGIAVLAEYRQRGYGDALLAYTFALARNARSDLLVLEALAADWPRTWYAARGFTELGLSQSLVRPASPPPDEGAPHASSNLQVD